MAGSFSDAFNKALSRIVGGKVGGKQPRERPKSSSKGLLGKIGTWQKSREIMEKTKGRISRIEPIEAVRGKVAQDQMIAGYPNPPEKRSIIQRAKSALGLDEARKLTRQKEFDMAVNDDPAFMAWINRVGAETDLSVKPGEDLTRTRLNYLCDVFGVEDPLALYNYIVNDPNFGYADFQAAYEQDGKNHQNRWNPAYKLEDAISMHMMQVMMFKKFPIYAVFKA